MDRCAGFWDPLRIREVRLRVAGLGLSQIGHWLYNVALIVLVLERKTIVSKPDAGSCWGPRAGRPMRRATSPPTRGPSRTCRRTPTS